MLFPVTFPSIVGARMMKPKSSKRRFSIVTFSEAGSRLPVVVYVATSPSVETSLEELFFLQTRQRFAPPLLFGTTHRNGRMKSWIVDEVDFFSLLVVFS